MAQALQDAKASLGDKKTWRATVLPMLGLLLAFTIFSLYTVLMKKALNDGSNALVIAFLREVVATSVLLPLAWIRAKRTHTHVYVPSGQDIGWFMLLGACMIWGTQLLSALSLQHISANNYALLAPTVPVFTLLIALVTGYEVFRVRSLPSWGKVAALIVTAGGAAYIAISAYMRAGPGKSRNVLLGNLLLLTNKVCVATYPVLEKRLLKSYADPSFVVAWGYAAGAVLTFMSIVPCALEPEAWHMSASGVGAIFFSGLVSSAFNYNLMCHVNKYTTPVLVMSAYPFQSIATPVLGWLILGAPVTADDATGGVIIILGLFCLIVARYFETKQSIGPGDGRGAHIELRDLDEEQAGRHNMIGSGGEGTPALNAAYMHDEPAKGGSSCTPRSARVALDRSTSEGSDSQ